LGYSLEWEVLNSKNFGVPQNRERVFILARHTGKGSGQKVFPLGQASKKSDRRNAEIANSLQCPGHSGGNYREMTMVRHRSTEAYKQGNVIPALRNSDKGEVRILHNIYGGFNEDKPREFKDYSPAIRTPKGGGHLPCVVAMRQRDRHGKNEGRGQQLEIRKDGLTNSLTSVEKDNYVVANAVTQDGYLATGRRKRVDGKAVLTSMHERRIRKLTPIECERLQSFPDNWIQGISDNQRYKCLGKAVTVNVIRAIVEKINGMYTN